MTESSLRIGVVPYVNFLGNDRFFCLDGDYWRDGGLEYCRRIWDVFHEAGHEIHTMDLSPPADCDRLLVFNFQPRALWNIARAGKLDRTVLIAFEPPVVQPMHSAENLLRLTAIVGRVLSWQDDLQGHAGIGKFHFPLPTPPPFDPVPFEERSFATAIYNCKFSRRQGELYSERLRTIRYFEGREDLEFDLYGPGWPAAEYPSWRGTVPRKYEVLRRYRFAICYENERGLAGLFSEKLFDSLFAGTVPVFWGAENVEKYLPPLTYIDRRHYPDHDSLVRALQAISADEYRERLAAIERYLASDFFRQRHSPDAFARRLLMVCQEEFPARRPRILKTAALAARWLAARFGPL